MSQQLSLFDTDFSDDNPSSSHTLINELKQFCEFGETSKVIEKEGVLYFINEFWTSRQRQGLRLHEISYRACFKPQLPSFFISRLTEPGDIVYDPFMGRGTTPLETAIQGRIPYGNDINPLSRAFIEPRINPPTLEEISTRLDEIPWDTFTEYHSKELLAFYHPETLTKLEGLKNWLLQRESSGEMDQTDRWIRMVAINRLTGHSSGFFSVYTLPPNQAVSVKRQIIINTKRKQSPEPRDIPAIIYKKSKSLLSQGTAVADCCRFFTCPSHDTPEIEDNSVALTVTSPPFLDVIDYEGDNWLRCWFIGIDPKQVEISNHKKIEACQAFTTDTLKELCRITRPGGYIAYEVGEVRGGSINLEDYVLAATKDLTLDVIGVMINQQEFTKTSNCWGVSNNTSGTNSNRIVIFQKPC